MPALVRDACWLLFSDAVLSRNLVHDEQKACEGPQTPYFSLINFIRLPAPRQCGPVKIFKKCLQLNVLKIVFLFFSISDRHHRFFNMASLSQTIVAGLLVSHRPEDWQRNLILDLMTHTLQCAYNTCTKSAVYKETGNDK